jgi:Gnt-I system high-affinity gluconate transporter
MAILAIAITLLLLVLLISRWHFNPFIAFLISSIVAGILLGIPLADIPQSLEKGIGNMLGSIVVIVCLGAMFGKLIADSGAAQAISQWLMSCFGEKYLIWALMLTGFVVGIPLFYNVGFVLLVPLVFSVAYQTRLSAVYLGIPLLAALSVTHGFLPPSPAPTALVAQFGADLGKTLIYGLIIAVPTVIIAGPIFTMRLKNMACTPLATFTPKLMSAEELPGKFNSFVTSLLPVLLIAIASALPQAQLAESRSGQALLLLSNPMILMLLSLIIASYTLAIARGVSVKSLMETYASAIKDIALILLIIAGAGALKQVFVDSGVSSQIAAYLDGVSLNPLLMGWFVAVVIRVCLGSATVAGLTAAGIVAPLVLANPDINPNLMVLAIGAGSLMCSHVNDSGFWMYKEYFNLSLKDTFKSWTLMETLVGLVGLVGVLLLDWLI